VWYQHGVRTLAMFAVVALCAACGGPGESSTAGQSPSHSSVNPARIDRVRTEMPDGYEVSDVTGTGGRMSPAAFWGLDEKWAADPPQCAVLADPAADGRAHGWSASGPGGTVYAAAAPGRQLDPALASQCGHWMVSAGRTTGAVALTPGPAIVGASTVGMDSTLTTVVEGGTEFRSRGDTMTAYLDDHVAFITVLTDPGSPNPQLGQEFAAALLAKTVSALRG
jgi:hypothetical protein